MRGINRKKLKIKNLIGIIENPTLEDLLFEIVDFLEKEGRLEEEFIKQEVNLKTRCRISSDLEEDLINLSALGYIEKLKYTKYKILKHPW